MKNIVVSGYYGARNGGDEAILAAIIEVLTGLNQKLNITVISSDPQDTHTRHGVRAVGFTNFGQIVAELWQADLFISGGGSLLQNVTSGRSLYYYLGIITLAKLLRCPVMLYAQGIGPIHGTFARKLMRFIGNCLDLITVRDRGSLDELAALGITKPHIECTADPVLAIRPVDKAAGREILAAHLVKDNKPLVGISVREWRGWQHYKDVLAETVGRISRDLDVQVVFFPMQFPEDLIVAKAIAIAAKTDAVVLEREYSTAELLSLVGNMELVISVRLHALIFAGVMDVPMLGLSYDPKIDRFLASLGEKPVGNLEDITADKLTTEIDKLWQERQSAHHGNSRKLKELRRAAAKNAQLALSLLGHR